jgi:hypothetical protein
MLDLYPDGKIDCKDYAVHNSIEVLKNGYAPKWQVTKDHVVVTFSDGKFDYILDGERVYRLPRGLLKGLGF